MNSRAASMKRLEALGIVSFVFLAGCGGTTNSGSATVGITPPSPAQSPSATLLISDTPPAGVPSARVPSLIEHPEKSRAKVAAEYGKLPLSFEANRGQTDPHAMFISRGSGYTLYLTSTETVLTLRQTSGSVQPTAGLENPQISSKRTDIGETQGAKREEAKGHIQSAVRMKLVGANLAAGIEGLEPLPGKSNYFIGNDPTKWRTNIPTYAKVRYRDIYPGVDLVYYGNQGQLEHDFIVAPGADPKAIQLGFEGAKELRIDAHGNLVMRASGGEVRLQKPIVYQSTPANGPPATDRSVGQQFVTARYVLRGNRVGFAVAGYDARKPLIIDPALSYSTYLGGSGSDSGAGIAIDIAGNAYLTGQTSSTDFPTTNPFQGTLGGGADVFVAKLSSSGSTLIYSTYLGGSAFDSGSGIEVDGVGNAYVTGQTSSADFPTKNPFQGVVLGSGNIYNAFIAKLDSSGSTLLYSTYLGGSGFNSGTGIAVDGVGNAYVTGQTSSADFPTKNPLQAGLSGSARANAFVAKIDTTKSGNGSLVYSTYLGGSGSDIGLGIAVDSSGNAYVTGSTQSSNFPTVNPLQPSLGGGPCFDYGYFPYFPSSCADAFVAKLNPAGSALVFSTYLGGNDDDRGAGIAVDSSGIYVTGHTASMNFPTANPIQVALGGFGNAFVVKLNAAGSALMYSTYLGGNGDDQGRGITVDSSGNAYVTGSTSSTDFPTVFPVQVFNDGSHAFITKLNTAGSQLVYSTYLGGSGSDSGAGIAVDATGNAYVTGNTTSSNFPKLNPLQTSLRGFSDAFVSKIAPIPGPAVAMSAANLSFTMQPINTTSPPQTVMLTNRGDGTLTITGIALAGTNSGDFAQTNTCGTPPAEFASGASCAFSVTFTPTATGTRTGMVTITDNAAGSPHTVSLLGNFVPPDFTISASPSTATVSAGGSATSTLTISPVSDFTGSVSLACSGLPTYSNCLFSPNPVTVGATPATSTLTISTTAGSAMLAPPFGRLRIKPLYAFGLALLGMVLIGVGISGWTSKNLRIGSFSVGLLFILVAAQAGCGGTTNQVRLGTRGTPGTPPGTYSITVTGTSSSLQRSTAITLTVR